MNYPLYSDRGKELSNEAYSKLKNVILKERRYDEVGTAQRNPYH